MAKFRIKELSHRSCHPTQVEAHAVFHRGQIQFFLHQCVYIHTTAGFVNRLLFGLEIAFDFDEVRARAPNLLRNTITGSTVRFSADRIKGITLRSPLPSEPAVRVRTSEVAGPGQLRLLHEQPRPAPE